MLRAVAVVEVKVEFVQIYADQPLFAGASAWSWLVATQSATIRASVAWPLCLRLCLRVSEPQSLRVSLTAARRQMSTARSGGAGSSFTASCRSRAAA